MRGEKAPLTGGPDDAEDSIENVRVEPIISSEQDGSSAHKRISAPGWTKRVSTRGKLARGLIITLAVIVAVVVVLPRTSVTLPPQIVRLLTPAPTQTPTPGQFTVGEWEAAPAPSVPGAMANGLAPFPRDPETAYACMAPEQNDPNGKAVSGEVSLWITHEVGRSWSRVALPHASGTNCHVAPALDGAQGMTVSVTDYALDQNTQACAHSRYFLSEDGLTWREIQHASLAPATSSNGDCELWATARLLFMNTFFSDNGDQGHTILERSDDGGLTWRRADHGLESVGVSWYPQLLDNSGESLVTVVNKDTNGSGIVFQSDLWMTRDAGATWRRVGPIALTASQTNNWIDFLLTEAGRGNGQQLCHCLFGASVSRSSPFIVGQHIYRTTDYSHWTPLPPVPVKGTSASRSGVYSVLDTTPDGKLLALGADFGVGVQSLPDHNGQVSGPLPRLWAWDMRAGRWEVANNGTLPCDDLQSCDLSSAGVSTSSGQDGMARGTYLWVAALTSAKYYRIFIPSV
jgi:hypothetical protein